jgi:thiol-disulfide isomerase/thioredoxin
MSLTSLQTNLRSWAINKVATIKPYIQLHINLLIALCFTAIVTHAQKFPIPSVNIGDQAPLLQLKTWLKGTPIQKFEKGKTYVLEFWATWCRPCRAAMPYLSELARKYKDRAIFIGVDVLETKKTTLNQIKTFVTNMGQQMDYQVAIADNDYMEKNWLFAAGEMGIPSTFIVDGEGKLAWIGHPCDNLEDALSKIIINDWDINESLAKRNLEFRLKNLEDSLIDQLEFGPDGSFRSDSWKQDSALLLINEMTKTEPLIKFTPRIAYQLFSILLKKDMKKAFEYGKKVIETTTYEKPAGFIIRGAIENLSNEISLPPEIYQLGIEAIQVELEEVLSCYPEIRNVYKHYYRMAKWYGVLGNKLKAVESLEKAIDIMKNQNDYIETDLALYEAWLKQYKQM